MNAENWARVRALYEDAIDMAPEDRREFLDREAADLEIRREVDSLLALENEAVEHFTQLAQRVGSTAIDAELGGEPEAESMHGQMVGPYRVLEELGRGGMGVVYLAERADGAFEHRVAVKLLPVGLPGPLGHQRFLAERQILARLQHPSIARLLDGGVTGDGRPYIVMEYVDGLPIDFWCDAAGLDVDERIKLFLEVCETIEYAHRNLVVHRDLKPGNVLVTGEAETKMLGQVKLLDFGIAKLLGGDSPELTRDEAERIPLTPAWASPEQLAGEPVTTATDVYTLSALLYRLLVGVPPHDLRGRSTGAIRERVLVDRPVPASQRLERLDTEQAERIATCRKSRPESLRRKLRGDLEAILLKGLARRPDARYGSPGALAADLRRHLNGHPVQARPARIGYRVGRFLGRHRAAVATTMVLAGLLSAVIWMVVRNIARITAERDTAQEVAELVTEVFAIPESDEVAGREPAASEPLDRATERVRARLHRSPLVRAGLLHTLGRAYRRLGDPQRAGELLNEALALRVGGGAVDEKRAETLYELGLALQATGDVDGARQALEEAVEIYERVSATPAHEYARSLATLAEIEDSRRRPERTQAPPSR